MLSESCKRSALEFSQAEAPDGLGLSAQLAAHISYSEVYWFYFNVKYVWKFHETLLTEKMIKCSIHLSRGSGWSERRPHHCLPQPVPSTIQVKKTNSQGSKIEKVEIKAKRIAWRITFMTRHKSLEGKLNAGSCWGSSRWFIDASS